jgi:hypothetical protein
MVRDTIPPPEIVWLDITPGEKEFLHTMLGDRGLYITSYRLNINEVDNLLVHRTGKPRYSFII